MKHHHWISLCFWVVGLFVGAWMESGKPANVAAVAKEPPQAFDLLLLVVDVQDKRTTLPEFIIHLHFDPTGPIQSQLVYPTAVPSLDQGFQKAFLQGAAPLTNPTATLANLEILSGLNWNSFVVLDRAAFGALLKELHKQGMQPLAYPATKITQQPDQETRRYYSGLWQTACLFMAKSQDAIDLRALIGSGHFLAADNFPGQKDQILLFPFAGIPSCRMVDTLTPAHALQSPALTAANQPAQLSPGGAP